MEYLDFVLRVDLGHGDDLVIRLVDSPAGEAEAPFAVPPVERLVERAAEDFERALDEGRDEVSFRDIDSPGPGSPFERQRAIGAQLFQALLPGVLRDRYHHSLGLLGRRQEAGLRIKLQMSIGDPRLGVLQNLPWELLYRADDESFLGRSRRTSIVRHLDLPLPGQIPRLGLPLRVLLVAPRPRGLRPLPHVQREMAALRQLAGPRLEVESLATPTLEGLRQYLLSGRFHVLHYLGHGGFDEEKREGMLYLEDGDGLPAPVRGPMLADHLRDITSLRLAILNACQTARTSAPGPFGGVAAALLRAGLPAVVAMQFPIQDRAAGAFSRGFYGRLIAGDPVDAAVAEGRLKIHRDLPDAADWATPVLFLRAPDGYVFEPPPRRSRRFSAIAAAAALLTLVASLVLFQNRTAPPPVHAGDPTPAAPAATPLPKPKPSTSRPPALKTSSPVPRPPEGRAPVPSALVHLLIPTSMSDATVWLDGRRAPIRNRTSTVVTIAVPTRGEHRFRLEKTGSPPCEKTVSGAQDGMILTPCQD